MIDDIKVLTIILGGGRGTRLFPLTARRAKPAVPIGGKYRLIDIPLSNSINSGYRWIYVLTQYASDSLIRHILETYNFGQFVRGRVQILAAQQTMENAVWYQGTADAIRHNINRFRNQGADYYLILSGDHLYRMDYRKLIAFHRDGGWDVSVCVTPISRRFADQFGVLKMDVDCRVREFVEKPRDPDVVEEFSMGAATRARFGVEDEDKCLAGSMGIYVFNPDVLEPYLDRDSVANDFGKEIIPDAMGKLKMGGYFFKDFWADIGTIRSYYETSIDMTGVNGFAFNHPEFPIYTHRRFLSATKIEDAMIQASLISEGATIRSSRIRSSIVGVRAVIDPDVEIEESIVMGNDYYDSERAEREHYPLGVGSGSRLRKVIVDKNVRIGRDCRLINEQGLDHYDGDQFFIRDGIIVIPKDTTLPPGTCI